jgi:hypothetical protein
MFMYSQPILPQYVWRKRFQDFAQRGDRLGSMLADGFAQAAGEEFAVQVPDGEAVGDRVELGMVGGLAAQRIEIGDQVAAHAVGVDELEHAGFLGDLGGAAAGSGQHHVRSGSQRTGWWGIFRCAKISS